MASGQNRYPKSAVLTLASPQVQVSAPKLNFCYARVSTRGQSDDLTRQAQLLSSRFPSYILIKDIGSGINFKRKGFKTLLDYALKGHIGEIVVTHKDRLCRFGFELFESILSRCSNGKIVVLNRRDLSPTEELTSDLLTIITVFASRLYGLRSHQVKTKINNLLQQEREGSQDTQGKLLPTKEEEATLRMMMEQSRWYYNFLVGVIRSHYSKEMMVEKGSFPDYHIRDFLSAYTYKEEEREDTIYRCFEERPDKETNTKQVVPPWWEGKVHSRLPRGVAKKITQNINSMISNYINGNIKDFELRCLSSKKTLNEFLLFEDKGFPAFIRRMKGRYCFTGKDGKKKKCSLQDLFDQTDPKGVEVIYEKDTKKYFFHYPVDADFYPEGDRRNENQAPLRSLDGKRIISLDPGVRKFMVGYDPDGKVVFVGKDAHREILTLLQEADKTRSRSTWRKIKNKVSELHWKTIQYLMLNYDHIMIPDFKVSQMVRGKKISRQTKRMLCMYSFYSFMLKLKYKCKRNGKKMYVVDESYTSKTCSLCGKLNDVGGKEVYQCRGCGNEIDRDVNGSRNILIKNLRQ